MEFMFFFFFLIFKLEIHADVNRGAKLWYQLHNILNGLSLYMPPALNLSICTKKKKNVDYL